MASIRPRPPRLTLIVAAALFVAGCSSPKYEELALRITDPASAQPIAGAEVILRPLKFYLPAGDSPSPTPGDFEADRGVTDAAGLIALRAAGNAPSELFITRPGRTPWRGVLEPWETAAGARTWRLNSAEVEPAGQAQLDVEIISSSALSASPE